MDEGRGEERRAAIRVRAGATNKAESLSVFAFLFEYREREEREV